MQRMFGSRFLTRFLSFCLCLSVLFSVCFSSTAYGYNETDADRDTVERLEGIIETYVEQYYPTYGDDFLFEIVVRLDDILERTADEQSERIITQVIVGLEDQNYDVLCDYEDSNCLIDYLDDTRDVGQNTSFADQENSKDMKDIAIYNLQQDTLISTSQDSIDPQHQTMRSMWSEMIPVSYRTPIIQFAIQTDGYGETMGLVYQDENDQNNWILSMDPEDVFLEDGTVDFKELQYTLIHEFGHILTLTNKELGNGAIPAQIVYGPEDEDARMDFVNKCTTYFPGEGCSTKDGYLYAFVQKFWQAEDHQALIKSTAMGEEKSEEDQEEFYTNNSEKFLTDYAATNPEEDIAESRTAFILQKKPTDSSLVSNEKILFFYDYDELVALRSSIRAHLFTQK